MKDAQFTLYLYEYLDEGYELPENINDFTEITLGELTYNIKDLFIKRNKYKEIGSETEDLFKHNLEVLINEALDKYNPQLILLNENFNKLMNRTITETEAELQTATDSGVAQGIEENKNYLQPSNATANKITDKQDFNTNRSYSNDKSFNRNATKEKSLPIFKSNAELLQKSYEVTGIITKILKFLDKAFMGLY